MTIAELRTLAKHAANRTTPENFSLDSVDRAFADGMKAFAGSINEFMKNRYDIYSILIENADIIVPNKVMDAMGAFAEIRNVAQGDKPLFKRGPIGRNRAKRFLTQVGLSGVYESFRLDSETYTIGMKAIGGAVSLDFERMIDGAENLADFMEVLAEAQVEGIYGEVQKALMAAASSTAMPSRNKVVGNYSADALVGVINTVKAYGGGATIFASPEFITAMGPDAIVPGFIYPVGSQTPNAGMQGIYSPDDIEMIHRTGIIKVFRGTPVVELKQSFLDEKNEKVMINPQFAYILPTGKEKVVKVVMEGQTQMWDYVNPDQSVEVNTYRKIGVGIEAYNNWGVYRNTSISDADWYDSGALDLGVDYHINL